MKNLLTLWGVLWSMTVFAQSLSVQLTSTNTNCSECTGTMAATVTGGVTPYVYQWSNGATTTAITDLCTGPYGVTVTDATGQTKTAYSTLYGADLVITGNVLNTFCANSCNGSIDISVNGGTSPISYSWSMGVASADVNNLCAGSSYTVTVTDGTGCSNVKSFTVWQTSCLLVTAAVADVSCNGMSNGAINLTATGNGGPFTYNWAHIVSTNNPEDLSGVSSGNYSVTVTDSYGCTASLVATVNQPPPLIINGTVTNTSNGMNNGAIDVNVIGGTAPYSYLWSTGGTSDPGGLVMGVYTVTVTDSHGCTNSKAFTVFDSSSSCNLSVSIIPDMANAKLYAVVTGAVEPLTYLWGGSTSTGQMISYSITNPGLYCVTVTNNSGCAASACYSTQITVSGVGIPVTCAGQDGAINISVWGGIQGPYTFDWSNDGPENPDNDLQSLTNLTSGSYTVTVTSAAGITNVASFYVPNTNGQPVATSISSSNPSYCNVSQNLTGNSQTCEKVCPNTAVLYSLDFDENSCISPPSAFQWTVTGAQEYSVSADQREIQVVWGSTGAGNLTVSSMNGQYCFSANRCIDILALPEAAFSTTPAPDPATGVIQVCKGQSVWFQNESTDAAGYEWQFPDDLSNTNERDVQHTFHTAGLFQVLMIARTECFCVDSAWVMVEVLDGVSPLVDCVSTICPGEEVTYSSNVDCGQYIWTVSPNGTITGGGGVADSTVTVLWSGGAAGTIALNAIACSGSTCPATALVQIPILSNQAEIGGRDRVCPKTEETYEITGFDGSNYTWSVQYGTIMEGQGRNKIVVRWSDITTADAKVVVHYDNCDLGCSGADTLLVKIRPPFYISGQVEACSNAELAFFAQKKGGGYISSAWEITNPQGVLLPPVSNGISVSVTLDDGPGKYLLTAFPVGAGLDQTCSDSASWAVNIKPIPPGVAGITGPIVFCSGEPLAYSATGVSPEFNVIWTAKNTNGALFYDNSPTALVTFSSGSPRWVAAQLVSTDGLNCLGDTLTLQVTELPPFQVSGPAGVCPGTTATYTAPVNDGVKYQWTIVPASAGVVVSGQNTASVQINWLEVGDHSISAISCGQSTAYPVTVWANPIPDPIYPEGVCPGQQATVQANGIFNNYQWKNSSGQVVSTNTTAQLGAGSFALAVTDAHGCKGITEFSMVVYPKPNVRISTVDRLVFCNELIEVDFSALVDADGDFQYEWFRDNQSEGIGPTFTTWTTGDYRVEVTNQYGCKDSDGIVKVKEDCNPGTPVPSPGCSIGIDPILIQPSAECDSFTFQVNPTAVYVPGTADWYIVRQGFEVLTSFSGETGGFRFPNAGQFIAVLIVQLADGSFCAIEQVVDVLAHAQFTVKTGCPGESTQFTDESTFLPGAENGVSWHWDFNDFASANSDTSIVRNPAWNFSNPLVFNVNMQITAANGCTSSAQQTVNVPDLPTVTFLPQTLTCAGSVVPLAVANTNNLAGVAWNFGDPSSGAQNMTSGAAVFHKYTNAGTYSAIVTATNIFGCAASDTFPVNITPNNLSGTISPGQNAICEGHSVVLEAPLQNLPGASFHWNNGSSTPTIEVDDAGAYRVTITTADGCTYSPADKIIEINPNPDGSINALLFNENEQFTGFVTQQLAICQGEEVYLKVKDNGVYSYNWSDGTSEGDNLSFTEIRDNLLEEGTYQYAVTLTNTTTGCTASTQPFTVEVHPVPSGFSATANQYCAGTPSLVSYDGPQSPDWQLFWNNGEVGPSFETEAPGHFFVKVINQFGCRAESNRVTIHPGPNIGAIPSGCHTRCTPDELCIPNLPEIVSWQWYFEGNPIPGATSPNFTATESGSYHVAVVDFTGCAALSESLNLTLYTGLGDVTGHVWSDVNNNGLIDAADTLMTNISVQLWENDTLRVALPTAANGSVTFADILSVPYTLSVDSSALPIYWEIVVGQDSAVLLGCDAVATADLLLHHTECLPMNHPINVQVCAGTQYDYQGTMVSAGETKVFSYKTLFDCDSTVTVQVSAFPVPTTTQPLMTCSGDSILFNGVMLAPGSNQTFTMVHPVTGCDSIVTVQVSAFPIPSTTQTLLTCPGDSILFNGLMLAPGSNQIFTMVHPVTGCDSIVTVQVNAFPVPTTTQTLMTCPGDSISFNSIMLAPGSNQTFTLVHPVTGCDSIVTVQVNAFPIPTTAQMLTACEGDSIPYNGTLVLAGTTQNFTLVHPVTGCDSIVELTVQALPLPITDLSVTICPGSTYNYNGQPLTADSTYEFHYLSQTGACDSTVFLAISAWPELSAALTTQSSCADKSTGVIQIAGLPDMTEVALFSTSPDWQTNPTLTDIPPGVQTILIRDIHDCILADTITVPEREPLMITLPEAQLLPCDSPMIQLVPVVSGDTTLIQWQWNTGAVSQSITVDQPGIYNVLVTTECEVHTRFTTVSWGTPDIPRELIYIPNVVAPEADNPENALFRPFVAPGVTVLSYRAEVFDRWGELIWRSFDPAESWDTRLAVRASKMAGPAVFVWWLEAEVEWCGRPVVLKKKGDVTVVR